MPTAIELLENPELDITPITANTAGALGYSKSELAHFRIGKDDIEKLVIQVYEDGRRKKAKSKKSAKRKNEIKNVKPTVRKNLRNHIRDASFEDNLERTPTFTLVVHDPDWELLNTGILDNPIDINPGGLDRRWYTLVNVNVDDDDIVMTFETQNAVLLTHEHRPMKANRKRMTRAEFIQALVRRVKYKRIPYFAPELHKKQKEEKLESDSERKRDDERSAGFTPSDTITVNGITATGHQRKVISDAIEAGSDKRAHSLVIVAAVACVIVESGAGTNNHRSGAPYWGVFQQNPGDGWPATSEGTQGVGNVYKDAVGDGSLGRKSGGFYGWAIPIWNRNPNRDLGEFVKESQGAVGPGNWDYAFKINKARDEAQHAVNAWGIDVEDPGVTPGVNQTPVKKKYEFQVPEDGKDRENYLDAIYRLADEVKWSAYWVKDTLHFASQNDLFKGRSRKRLRRGFDGIEHVSFEWDHVEKVDNMLIRARMERWVCPVGTVVTFDEGGPGAGRWLVTGIRKSVFDQLGDITLSKPIKERLEPINPGYRASTPKPGATPLPDLGTGDVLGRITRSMTAKQVIDQVIIPVAQDFNMTSGIDASRVEYANGVHSTYTDSGYVSWHKGGPEFNYNIRYAIDMGQGTTSPTTDLDNLAEFLRTQLGFAQWPHPGAKNNAEGANNYLNIDKKGFRFQLIWRAPNHFDHVHFGVWKLPSGPPH